jgi:hypothetical protein
MPSMAVPATVASAHPVAVPTVATTSPVATVGHVTAPVVGGLVTGGGTYLGHGLAVGNGGLVVHDWPVGSVLHGSKVLPGSTILGVNGTSYVRPDVVAVGRHFTDHPLAVGDVVDYRTPQGTVAQTVLGNATDDGTAAPGVAALCDVKLLGVRALQPSAYEFQPAVHVEVAQRGDYRLVDPQGKPLGAWSELGPHTTAELIGSAVPRVPGDRYELFVERRQGNDLRLFQAAFTLSVPNNN